MIPTIDLSAGADVAGQIDEACRTVGFFAITGHGVAPSLVHEVMHISASFFEQPLEEKLRYRSVYGPYGYSPMEAEALAGAYDAAASPDLKESFDIGPFHLSPTELSAGGLGMRAVDWPDTPVEFRATCTSYYRLMTQLSLRLLSHAEEALGLERGVMSRMFDRHTSALRVLNYPELEVAPMPGQLRAGEHTDYGSFTILAPGEGEGGLEVKAVDGSWHPVQPIENAFVVNIGDLMPRWTNDRWISTAHRVAIPSSSTERRQSIAFFQNPNHDAWIQVAPELVPPGDQTRYEPVQFGSWLREKVAAAGH